MISVSPSILDTYRRAAAGIYIDNGDQLENELIGPKVKTEAMSRGTAWHLMIEHGTKRYLSGNGFCIVSEPEFGKDWIFGQKEIEAVEFLRGIYPDMIHELSDKVVFDIDGVQVVMNLRIDALWFDTLIEFKTKGSTPSYMEYFDSIQWRCYMEAIRDIQVAKYHVAQFNSKGELSTLHEYEFGNDGKCRDYIEQLLRGFIGWAKTRPLVWQWLEQRAKTK